MSLKQLSVKQKVNKILLSIKPKYVEEIKSGKKKFEYRKSIFTNSNVDIVVIYASSPISKAIGEFKIKQIIKDEPHKVWNLTKNGSGITEDFFYEYFNSKEFAYAIEIEDFKLYNDPIDISTKYQLKAPQSFCYIKNP